MDAEQLNDIHLIYGYLLAHGEVPQPVQDAIDRLRGSQPADEAIDEEEEIEAEEEPAPKPKRTNNMSAEARAAAGERMRQMQARKKAEREGRIYEPPSEKEPEGNAAAPDGNGASE
jgi:hypothetical protein